MAILSASSHSNPVPAFQDGIRFRWQASLQIWHMWHCGQTTPPSLLHKPDIVSRFAKWRRQSQYGGWVIELAIAERLLSVQVLTPTPDEGSCWRGLWHVCDSSLLQLVWHTNYCGPTWFFVAATLPYCCSSIWMMCAVWTTNCPLKRASNSGDWLHCWQNILRDPSLTTTLC